jgi:hypothetical protein
MLSLRLVIMTAPVGTVAFGLGVQERVPPENSIVSLTCPFVCAAGAVMVG